MYSGNDANKGQNHQLYKTSKLWDDCIRVTLLDDRDYTILRGRIVFYISFGAQLGILVAALRFDIPIHTTRPWPTQWFLLFCGVPLPPYLGVAIVAIHAWLKEQSRGSTSETSETRNWLRSSAVTATTTCLVSVVGLSLGIGFALRHGRVEPILASYLIQCTLWICLYAEIEYWKPQARRGGSVNTPTELDMDRYVSRLLI
jgi:hypothetical protein